jgi:hypothetical protein
VKFAQSSRPALPSAANAGHDRRVSVRRPRAFAPLILACALVVLLLLPVGANAASSQFGSALAPGPTAGFGCGQRPFLADTSGNYGLFTNTEPGGCTWRQSGVWGAESDPRTSGVPGDGTITAAEVLSGPDPAPIRISVLRQLGTGGFSGQCCFFVRETEPIALTPNAVTTIPLAIPVERNTLKGFLAVDLMAISADGNTGSLPLRVVGSTNIFNEPVGNSRAGAFYPRMGQIGNDSGGGRREEGVPGLEVLVRWTFCPAGDATCTPGAVPPPVAAPTTPAPPATTPTPAPKGTGGPVAPRLAGNAATVEGAKALVALVCGGDAACEGKLSLLGSTATASAAGKKPKPVVYGAASYKLAAGAKGTVKVTLNAKGKKLLRKHAKATVTLRLAPKGGAATTAELTLTRATAKR